MSNETERNEQQDSIPSIAKNVMEMFKEADIEITRFVISYDEHKPTQIRWIEFHVAE